MNNTPEYMGWNWGRFFLAVATGGTSEAVRAVAKKDVYIPPSSPIEVLDTEPHIRTTTDPTPYEIWQEAIEEIVSEPLETASPGEMDFPGWYAWVEDLPMSETPWMVDPSSWIPREETLMDRIKELAGPIAAGLGVYGAFFR